MICLDTNIIIYLVQGMLDASVLKSKHIVYPSIVKIEALGFSEIKSIEEQGIRALLDLLEEIPLTGGVTERAIRLRQQRKMSLGDALVAASALESDAILWTANTEDYAHIEGLKLFNPMKQA